MTFKPSKSEIYSVVGVWNCSPLSMRSPNDVSALHIFPLVALARATASTVACSIGDWCSAKKSMKLPGYTLILVSPWTENNLIKACIGLVRSPLRFFYFLHYTTYSHCNGQCSSCICDHKQGQKVQGKCIIGTVPAQLWPTLDGVLLVDIGCTATSAVVCCPRKVCWPVYMLCIMMK